jgi:SAM-dependent methyltransferase
MTNLIWDSLSERFNTHKDLKSIHADAAVNIHVGWPTFFFHIDMLKRELGKDQLDIIDFGCGAGALCEELYKRGHNVSGYDHSIKMLNLAKQHTTPKIQYIHSLERNLKDTQFSEKFDLVTSMHSLEWIEDIEDTFKVLAKTLRKGGLLLFAVFPKQHIRESIEKKDLFEQFNSIINPQKGIANFDGIQVPVYIRDPEEFTKILQKLSFEKILEYYPQYPKNFFETYNWTGAKYPEMVIMSYKKL